MNHARVRTRHRNRSSMGIRPTALVVALAICVLGQVSDHGRAEAALVSGLIIGPKVRAGDTIEVSLISQTQPPRPYTFKANIMGGNHYSMLVPKSGKYDIVYVDNDRQGWKGSIWVSETPKTENITFEKDVSYLINGPGVSAGETIELSLIRQTQTPRPDTLGFKVIIVDGAFPLGPQRYKVGAPVAINDTSYSMHAPEAGTYEVEYVDGNRQKWTASITIPNKPERVRIELRKWEE